MQLSIYGQRLFNLAQEAAEFSPEPVTTEISFYGGLVMGLFIAQEHPQFVGLALEDINKTAQREMKKIIDPHITGALDLKT